MSKCPTCGRQLPPPLIEDEQIFLAYLHFGGRIREVYETKDGRWVFSYSGELPDEARHGVSSDLIKNMALEGKIFPKYDNTNACYWTFPKTFLVEESLQRHREGKNNVYIDAHTGVRVYGD